MHHFFVQNKIFQPKIDGFDVDKFREANRPNMSIVVRLPTSDSG